MPRNYQRKTQTKYKLDDLVKAIDDVKNQKRSLTEASAAYCVPKSTIHDYIRKQGREPKTKKNTVFSTEQEKVLEEHIIKCSNHFNGMTKDIVRKIAFKFADVNNLRHNFDMISQMAGSDWFYRFKERHPNISIQKAKFCADSIDETKIKMFFDNWAALLHVEAKTVSSNALSSGDSPYPSYITVEILGGRFGRWVSPRRSSRILFSKCQNQIGMETIEARNTKTTATRKIKCESIAPEKGNPERLAVLCERVLKKYGLLPPEPLPPKGIVEPTDYSVIGGKPLRKRKEPVPEEPKERPITKRGRPKKEKEVKKKVDGRCRQRKYEVQHFTITSASDITITGLEPECVRIKTEEFDSPPDHRKNEEQHFTMSPASDITDTGLEPECVRIKTEELDLPLEHDPLIEDDPEYLVGVKEETPDEENNEDQKPIVAGPSVPETNCLMPTLVPALKPGQPSTSKVNPATVPVMTVVLDDIQIFANSVAEQLRALPLNRALLLQLGIQNMLDAEKHFSYNA